MRVSMRAFQFPSRLCREYDRFADDCQHFFFDNAKKKFCEVRSRKEKRLFRQKRELRAR